MKEPGPKHKHMSQYSVPFLFKPCRAFNSLAFKRFQVTSQLSLWGCRAKGLGRDIGIGPWTCFVSSECIHYAAQQPCFFLNKATTRSFNLYSVFFGRNRARPLLHCLLKENWLTLLTHWFSPYYSLWPFKSKSSVKRSIFCCSADSKPQTFGVLLCCWLLLYYLSLPLGLSNNFNYFLIFSYNFILVQL